MPRRDRDTAGTYVPCTLCPLRFYYRWVDVAMGCMTMMLVQGAFFPLPSPTVHGQTGSQ
jgi:hypothetical protein